MSGKIELNAREGAILRVMRNWYLDCSGYAVCDICPDKGHDGCEGKHSPSCPINTMKEKLGK